MRLAESMLNRYRCHGGNRNLWDTAESGQTPRKHPQGGTRERFFQPVLVQFRHRRDERYAVFGHCHRTGHAGFLPVRRTQEKGREHSSVLISGDEFVEFVAATDFVGGAE